MPMPQLFTRAWSSPVYLFHRSLTIFWWFWQYLSIGERQYCNGCQQVKQSWIRRHPRRGTLAWRLGHTADGCPDHRWRSRPGPALEHGYTRTNNKITVRTEPTSWLIANHFNSTGFSKQSKISTVDPRRRDFSVRLILLYFTCCSQQYFWILYKLICFVSSALSSVFL